MSCANHNGSTEAKDVEEKGWQAYNLEEDRKAKDVQAKVLSTKDKWKYTTKVEETGATKKRWR